MKVLARKLLSSILVLMIAIGGFGWFTHTPSAIAANNGLGEKPYMGWSSWSMQVYDGAGNWNSEAKIKAMSDAMHTTLQSHGYNYINIDAGWQGSMDGYGRPIPSTTLYPNGFQNLIDYVHNNGQKIGVYMIPGLSKYAYEQNLPIFGTTCHMQDIAAQPLRKADYWDIGYKIDFSNPCAQKYIDSIADLFGEWGIDFLKLDSVTPGSGHNDTSIDARDDVAAWSKALEPHGIWFELSWALDHYYVDTWKKYANGWRVNWDVEAYQPGVKLTEWNNIARLFPDAAVWWRDAGPGGWNDFDSLNVGNGAMDGLTQDERRTAMTLWSMACAPLYLGNDLTNLDSFGIQLLTNDEVIAVNQAGRPAHPVSTATNQQAWYANNGDGSYTVALVNLGNSASTVNVNWSDIGLNGSATVRDLWTHTDLGTFATGFSSVNLAPHASRLLRVVSNGGSNVVNDDDTGIVYTGDWYRSANRGFGDFKDDVHYTNTNGDYFEFKFNGTGVEMFTEKSADQGNVDIYIDGVLKQTVNTFNATRQTQQKVYGITGLSNGLHTLKVVKKSGDFMLLDKLSFNVASPIEVNDTDTGITYNGSWSLSSARGYGDYKDDVHYTTTNNDYFQFSFTGTGVDLITEKEASQGDIDIYVDNVFKQTVSTYNPTRLAQQTVYSISGLPSGTHTIKGVKKSGTYMVLDKFNVRSNRIQVNNTDSGITYSGSWHQNWNRGFGDYNDDVHYTSTNNDYLQYTFTGTGIELLTEKAADQGNVDIYIDNVLMQTVNTFNATRLTNQVIYSVSGLSSGSHTIKMVKKSGTFMLLDSLRIIP
ncbi:glycoside hydrolase family 27 protein [Paenibacillus sp. LHD-117]|uniref:glycoside hydrolase family 27 protein n=1 Tax=Paenibacillus sp. LHD-117 TaxID=3071412 RepID=UPI0027E07B8A|nr:glycoside hydrolase family 27 protein [Paenibacillus sp. LHD-117]MDQ6418515.1 glycoside hydrolase family 27 protein [Paenibacillus sp. LHD-117]